jgi:hypothetical protein
MNANRLKILQMKSKGGVGMSVLSDTISKYIEDNERNGDDVEISLKSVKEDYKKMRENTTQRKQLVCNVCGSTALSYTEGIVCLSCGGMVCSNYVSSAEEASVVFNNCSNRKSTYTSYSEVGSSYKLQSCITGGKGKYNGNHVSQKNYQEETRLKNIKYIKQKLKLLPYISKAIGEQAIRAYVEFKIKGNTNRAQINKGIICAFVKRAALNEGIELTNKKLYEIFEVEIKHITKGIQIIIDAGYCINYDINCLIINYVKHNFMVLNLPKEHINVAIFLALFANQFMGTITTSFIPHSVCAWVVYFIILNEEIDVGIDPTNYKPNIYASKIKALFDNAQPTINDHLGRKREHIVSNVNITKIDRIMLPHKDKVRSIIDRCKSDKRFNMIRNY